MRLIFLRIFGVLNLVYWVLGVCYFAVMLWWHLPGWHGQFGLRDWGTFAALNAICLFLSSSLAYLGFKLFQGRESVLGFAVALNAAEVAYSLANVVVFWMVLPISMASKTIGFWQVAEGPLVPQLITWYPLWAMVMLGILWKFPRLFRRVR